MVKIKEKYLGLTSYYENLEEVIKLNKDYLSEEDILFIDTLEDLEDILKEKYNGMEYPKFEILKKYEVEIFETIRGFDGCQNFESNREYHSYFNTKEEAKKYIKEVIEAVDEEEEETTLEIELIEWFEDETNQMLNCWEIKKEVQ